MLTTLPSHRASFRLGNGLADGAHVLTDSGFLQSLQKAYVQK